MNLSTKIILSILCILILFMSGLTYFITRWQRSTFLKSAHHYSKVLGETICDSIAMEMSLGRSDLVQGTLEHIGQGSPHIRTLRILGLQGQILRSVRPDEIGKRIDLSQLKSHLKDAPTLFDHRRDREPLLSFIKTFPNRPECQKCHDRKEKIIGFLVLEVSNQPIEDLVSSSQRIILEGLGITLLMVVGSVFLVTSKWVRKPLSRVTEAMKKVENGNLDVRIDLASRDELGRVAHTFNSMVETISKNKRDIDILHQRELERTQRMATLGELAEAIAHEIRNPLAGVSASVKIIREQLEKEDPRAEAFNEIIFQTDRIEKIISNLLQFARKSTPQFSFYDIHGIIEKTLQLFSFQLQDQRVNVKREFQPNLPQVYADSTQIQHVLMNVIMNAIQSMPDGGILRVKTFHRPEETMVHLTIGDTGKGIPKEVLSKVFKPFYSAKAKGAGLGLTIVEKIIQEHGGKVVLHSEGKAGTTVEISLSISQSIKEKGS